MTETNGTPDREPALHAIPTVIPSVVPVAAVRTPRFRSPWPGWWGACVTTLVYWLVLLGVMLLVVVFAFALSYILGDQGNVAALGNQQVPGLVHLGLTLSMLLAYIGGLIYSIVALRLSVGRGWTRQIGLRRLPPLFVVLAFIALPGFVLSSDFTAQAATKAIESLCTSVGLEKPPTIEVNLAQQFSPYHWSLIVLIVGVAPGIAEEFWCRGFLGQGLVGRYGVVVGIGMTSLLFGFLHLWPPAYVITTAFMGLALHFTYLMSRSLWVPILIHTVNNSLAGLTKLKIINPEPMVRALDKMPAVLAILSFGLLFFAGYAMWSARGRLVNVQGEPGVAANPGVMVPPRESGLVVAHEKPNMIALMMTVIFFGTILYILITG